jgi:hypothetical protein
VRTKEFTVEEIATEREQWAIAALAPVLRPPKQIQLEPKCLRAVNKAHLPAKIRFRTQCPLPGRPDGGRVFVVRRCERFIERHAILTCRALVGQDRVIFLRP